MTLVSMRNTDRYSLREKKSERRSVLKPFCTVSVCFCVHKSHLYLKFRDPVLIRY
jgi:hypothetical protein